MYIDFVGCHPPHCLAEFYALYGEEFYVQSLLSLVLVIALRACKLDYGEIMLVYLSKKPYMLVRIKHKCQPIWESLRLCANMQGWTLKIHPAIPRLTL